MPTEPMWASTRRRASSILRLRGLVTPESPEATRICREDINEVIAAFVQDRTIAERGLFDEETAPEELTQMRMGMIVRERYPDLSPKPTGRRFGNMPSPRST